MEKRTECKILRYFAAEMRALDSGGMVVEGYPMKFEKETIIGSPKWGWREKIARTALDGARLDDVVFNLNHDNNLLLSRTTNGSLKLTPDNIGLKFEAKIIDTTTGVDAYKLVKEGLIARMSFAATIKKSKWTVSEDENEMDLREILEFDRLFDVSAVTFPAYGDTEIAARAGACIADADAERHYRNKRYMEQLKKLDKIIGGTTK